MAAQNTNEGVNKLAQAMQSRMHGVSGLNQQPLDFGTVQGDMSLLTNRFPRPIPQSDYLVGRSVAWGAVGSVFGETQGIGEANSGEHAHGPGGGHSHPDAGYGGAHDHPAGGGEMQHVHDVLVGDKFRQLAPGDRVLVAWVGDDACVIDIIYPATRI
jgi:hypothetical protein